MNIEGAVNIEEAAGGGGPGTIVVGVDGSAFSLEALRWAARQADLTGAALEVVTAWQFPAFYGWGPVPEGVVGERVDIAAECRSMLELAVKETLGSGWLSRARLLVVQGEPAAVLLEAATRAELLVVGCRGHGGFTGLPLGSISEQVISRTACPTVVVHYYGNGR